LGGGDTFYKLAESSPEGISGEGGRTALGGDAERGGITPSPVGVDYVINQREELSLKEGLPLAVSKGLKVLACSTSYLRKRKGPPCC